MSREMKNGRLKLLSWLQCTGFLTSWSEQAKVPGGMSDLKVVLVSAL